MRYLGRDDDELLRPREVAEIFGVRPHDDRAVGT